MKIVLKTSWWRIYPASTVQLVYIVWSWSLPRGFNKKELKSVSGKSSYLSCTVIAWSTWLRVVGGEGTGRPAPSGTDGRGRGCSLPGLSPSYSPSPSSASPYHLPGSHHLARPLAESTQTLLGVEAPLRSCGLAVMADATCSSVIG